MQYLFNTSVDLVETYFIQLYNASAPSFGMVIIIVLFTFQFIVVLFRYVGKRYRKLRHRAIHTYMMDVCCQMLAGHLVHRFNQALTNCPDDFLQVISPIGR